MTVGFLGALMNDDAGPPEDVVDGVQSTMTGLVDKAGGAVAAMAASVGAAVKASLGGLLKRAAPPAARRPRPHSPARATRAPRLMRASCARRSRSAHAF